MCDKLDTLKQKERKGSLSPEEEEERKSLPKKFNINVEKYGRVVFSALNVPSDSVPLVATKEEAEEAEEVEEKAVMSGKKKKKEEIPVKFSLDANGMRTTTLSDHAALPHAESQLSSTVGIPEKFSCPATASTTRPSPC